MIRRHVSLLAWLVALEVFLTLLPPGTINQCLGQDLKPVLYRNPNLTVDAGVGLWAWPLPMDFDGDGDMDLVVSCPDKPFRGTYLFENTGRTDPNRPKLPILEPPTRLGDEGRNVQLSNVNNESFVLTPETWHRDFRSEIFSKGTPLGVKTKQIHEGRIRANQWKLVDLDGDDTLDLVVGVGDWQEYGWDNAFDSTGTWTNGPLHGWIYWLKNSGTLEEPSFGEPQRLTTAAGEIDVYGMPSPNFSDWDGDGDLDLICGEFLDGFTYFQNQGDQNTPRFAAGVRLNSGGRPLQMDLQMIVPVAVDWDGDGDADLVVGDEDGRVAFIECLGVEDDLPKFSEPYYFRQRADRVKFGALVTPVSVDWDGDGDEDLVCGNTAGYLGWIENLDGQNPPMWDAPKLLKVEGRPIRLQAGPQGSIQGPCEAKWGYSTLAVSDWNSDGLDDVIVNGIWGNVVWFPRLAEDEPTAMGAARPLRVNWEDRPMKPAWNWWNPKDGEMATQWRTTPTVMDWDHDGLQDLVMLDHEGYLALFRREKTKDASWLAEGRRIFNSSGASGYDSAHRVTRKESGLLQLNTKTAGASGRRKIGWVDWDGDGHLDLLVNSRNVDWLRGKPGIDGGYQLEPQGPLASTQLAGHTTSPTTVDWNQDGIPDLLVGAEDGFLYYLQNPRTAPKSEDR